MVEIKPITTVVNCPMEDCTHNELGVCQAGMITLSADVSPAIINFYCETYKREG